MYIFKGITREMFDRQDEPHFKPTYEIKEFDDLDDAKDYANDNYFQYGNFHIIDKETNEIEYSKKMADDEAEAIDDMMFPNEDSREGFDY